MNDISAYRIDVTGVVQGVGFRPFVYNLARKMKLAGWVLNHSGGVEIEAEGADEDLRAFVELLRTEAPPIARIESLVATPIPSNGHKAFVIRESERVEGRYQLISPDVATCPDCLRELFDPADRRYRYPFTNCTNCGPRFTIITEIPYDRPNTTMRSFPLCPNCAAEYGDPSDRRFHAQPNACSVCGPHLWLVDSAGRAIAASPVVRADDQVLEEVTRRLLAGEIIAVKGLGGFQLACDATNETAVATLRERKRRPHKPFAVMVADMDQARSLCHVAPAEEELLASPQCPIVLLDKKDLAIVCDEVAPGSPALGIMLPNTPLHHLLLRDVGRPLVMTSGNLSEEPIARDNVEAVRRLGTLADAILLHDRDVHARYDDSVWHVVRVSAGHPQPLRRARGYAPFPVRLPFDPIPTLATGPLLKNTFCLTRDRYAFLSQHIGDLENIETVEHFESTLALYEHLFRVQPERIVCDMHPDYWSTRFAIQLARRAGLPQPFQAQHHAAHVASCLVDNGWTVEDGPIIGVALDGTGFGEDGRIWGGEWFVGSYDHLVRAAQLEYMPLAGGDVAIRRPARIAQGYLYALFGDRAVDVPRLQPGERATILRQVEREVNAPLTSSMGRLFDAVSALLGVCGEVSYEGQAAIELESLASHASVGEVDAALPFDVDEAGGVAQVRLERLFSALLAELHTNSSVESLAFRFHVTVAEIVASVCERLREGGASNTVALSGGVFQNRLLLQLAVPLLEQRGFRVLLHRQVPANDGGLSLGQIALAHFALSQPD